MVCFPPFLKALTWRIWSRETWHLWKAHRFESVWFPPAEENEAHADTLSDYVLENRLWMQHCSGSLVLFMCLVISSVCLSLFFIYTPPTVRSVYDVWVPFLLNDYTIHWRAPQTLVLWVWVDHISTLFDHQRGSSVQADTFYAVRKLCRSAVCQYATTKVDDI